MDPRTFGKYRILSRLSGGGMGRVYLAEDTESKRSVALKLIDIAADEDSREILEAERRGAALHARLCAIDPRVAQIYEAGEREGYFFIAMEYVEGRDLSEIIATDGPLPPRRAIEIAIALCEVLSHAHGFRGTVGAIEYHGIVHGDIKPRNLRITRSGEVKVLDFGIAKALSLTHGFTRNVFGSVRYASPERLNSGEVDEASDVWSVGVVLYEMLRGKPYFHDENPARIEQAVRSYRALPAALLDIPLGLRQIVGKALAPDPSMRYPSADALRADLAAFRDGLPLSVENGAASHANGADPEATRRTARARPEPADDATRRTPRPPRPPETVSERRKRLIIPILFFGLIGFGFWNEWRVWSLGGQLKRELESEVLKDYEQGWARYQTLIKRTYLPMLLSGPRNALKDRLVRIADRVITDYRDIETVIVKETDWQRARVALSRALEIDSGDKQIRGKLRLTEGHLSRINAAGKNQGKSWNESKAQFEEARDLMKNSPDPHLGLARLYIYSFRDMEKAEKELREAERKDYRPGKREKAQLADGYRMQGDGWFREATRSRGAPQEGEYLQRADESYARSESFYNEAVPFSSTSEMLRRVGASRDVVARRFEEMRKRD